MQELTCYTRDCTCHLQGDHCELPRGSYDLCAKTTLLVPTDRETRSHNVGESNYAKHKIQPWDIWLEYGLNPWDADIVKRVLREKATDTRRLDYEKIIHICQERIRQIDAETGGDREKLELYIETAEHRLAEADLRGVLLGALTEGRSGGWLKGSPIDKKVQALVGSRVDANEAKQPPSELDWITKYITEEKFPPEHMRALCHIVGLFNDCKESEQEIFDFAKALHNKYVGTPDANTDE